MPDGVSPRVVIDTNIVISAVVSPRGTPARVLESWRRGAFLWIMAHDQLEELRNVATKTWLRRYELFGERIDDLTGALRESALWVTLPNDFDLPIHSRDVNDDFLLLCAPGAHADFLVTGDRDLLDIASNPALSSVRILTPRSFLDIIETSV